MKKIILTIYILLINLSLIIGNEIKFTGINLGLRDTSSKTIQVTFQLEWNNSWRIGTTPKGEVEAVFIRSKGSGYTDGFHTVSFAGGGSSQSATAELEVNGGEVIGVRILNKGAGYTTSPSGFSGLTTTGNDAILDVHVSPWWDAAWVFGKYRVKGTAEWKHMKLAAQGHSTGQGTSAICKVGRVDETMAYNRTNNPNTGVYYYRSQPSSGTFLISNAYILWDYGIDNISDDAEIEYQLHGIEMVYVPSGSYYLGSGGNEANSFYSQNSNNPYLVNSATAITIGSGAGELFYFSSNANQFGDQAGPIPAAFPNGFTAFYAMKHEISQQHYVDFLNTLKANQQDNRAKNSCSTIEAPGVAYLCPTCDVSQYTMNGVFYYISGMRWRCAIKTVSPASISNNIPARIETDLPHVPLSGRNWSDIAAIADWTSMRPMTELEFEKLARGTAKPVPEEFAWGLQAINTQFFNYTNYSAVNEVVSSGQSSSFGNGACVPCIQQSSQFGALRSGVFAKSQNDRVQAGASFYGALEMTGNVSEAVVTIANSQGRGFTHLHGDGMLSSNGFADISSWPGYVSGENTGVLGAIFRGSHVNDNACAPISTRPELPNNNNRQQFLGARFARTAPIN
jgi:formylglycine-generating enzyme required for sulfatase activity